MINLFQADQLVAKAAAEFVIVGGLALISHGSAYVTQVLDICYSRRRNNLEKIAEVLGPLNPRPRGFPDDLPFIWDWSTRHNGTNFTFKTSLCDNDLLGEVAGIGAYDVLKESIIVDLEGVLARVLSIDGLITAKETAGQPRDEAGLRELYALRDSNLDKEE